MPGPVRMIGSEPVMDFRQTDEQALLRRSVRSLPKPRSVPTSASGTRRNTFHRIDPRLAEMGCSGCSFEVAAPHSAVDYCIHRGARSRRSRRGLSVAAHNGLCASHIFMFGTEAQKQSYLKPLARGEKIGAWALTESTSGSDAAGMRTQAGRDGGDWVLNGSKAFTTHGRVGHVMVVMAVTDRAAGTRGISSFIVPRDTPGMTPGKKEAKLGMRASERQTCC